MKLVGACTWVSDTLRELLSGSHLCGCSQGPAWGPSNVRVEGTAVWSVPPVETGLFCGQAVAVTREYQAVAVTYEIQAQGIPRSYSTARGAVKDGGPCV